MTGWGSFFVFDKWQKGYSINDNMVCANDPNRKDGFFCLYSLFLDERVGDWIVVVVITAENDDG